MSLNVKNKEAVELARELAAETGETITKAVTEALRERLERTRKGAAGSLSERLLAIGKDTASRLQEPFKTDDAGDLLHDEAGLPR